MAGGREDESDGFWSIETCVDVDGAMVDLFNLDPCVVS